MFQFLNSTFSDLIAYSLTTVFTIVGNLVAIAAKGLNYAVFVRPGGNILVVETTWKILRDFSNMVFIILLIYMAFATIFDQGKYTFKDMIVRFLIVAILINFSLVIGYLVIDACQVLTNIFLGSIGNVGDRLGTYLNPFLLFPDAKSISGADMAGSGLISIVFAIILSLIFLFSLLVALVFAIILVAFIWALLIVSPIAWMSHILPGTNKWWSKWWSLFFGWNLFLPVYLFFMYLGLLFLSKRDEIIGTVITVNTVSGMSPANAPLLEGLSNSLSFNLLFFYIFAAVVMVGGTWAAKETVSALGGTGFEKGLGWAKGLVKKVPLPYVGNLQGAEAGYNARKAQFQQEGFKNPWLNKVYGGKDAQTRADAKASGVLGVRNAAQDQQSKDVNAWKERLKSLSPNEWRNMMVNTKIPTYQRLAAAELLREVGQLSSKELVDTYKLYGGDRSAGARKFLMDVDFSKLSEEERKAVLDDKDIKDIRVRQKLATAMAEKGDIDDSDKLVSLAKELYGPSNELGWREFLNAAKKKKLIKYAEAMAKLNLTPQDVERAADGSEIKDANGKSIKIFQPDGKPKLLSATEFVAEQTSKMKIEDLGEQGMGTWKDDNFKNALIKRLNKAQENDPRKKNKKNQIIPGAGERIIRDLKNKVKEDSSKIAVMHEIESKLRVGEAIESSDDFGNESDTK